MAFKDWFPPTAIYKGVSKMSKGSKDKKNKVDQATLLSPTQEELIDLIKQGLISGEGPFKDIFGGFNRQEFEQGVSNPLMKQFQEETLPMLQEKFISGNQVLGSGMRRGQLKAGKDFQSDLAKLMYQAQQDAKANKAGGINAILNKQPFENIVKQPAENSSIWSKLLPAAGTALGTVGGAALGPGGAAAGGAAGNVAGNAAAKAVAG